MIPSVSLPLNIEHNGQHPFAPKLSAKRKAARERARELPVESELKASSPAIVVGLLA